MLPAGNPGWHALRLSAVRGFATYLHTIDLACAMPRSYRRQPEDWFPGHAHNERCRVLMASARMPDHPAGAARRLAPFGLALRGERCWAMCGNFGWTRGLILRSSAYVPSVNWVKLSSEFGPVVLYGHGYAVMQSSAQCCPGSPAVKLGTFASNRDKCEPVAR